MVALSAAAAGAGAAAGGGGSAAAAGVGSRVAPVVSCADSARSERIS